MSDIDIIDNSSDSKILLNEFKLELDNINKICILSGFCSFGAFVDIANAVELSDTFLKCKLQIIVGLSIDADTFKVYDHYRENNFDDFLYYTLKTKTEDTKKVLELFKRKCANNTLEIRQAKEPIHAKLYLFRNDNLKRQCNHCIIGSSNFTHHGLQGQRELNTVIYLTKKETDKENLYTTEIYEWFDREWENATPLLNVKTQEEFFKKVLPELKDFKENNKEESNDKEEIKEENIITPNNLYYKVIYEYFSSLKDDEIKYRPKDFGFINYEYQVDAIKSGLCSIKNYNGVLISDVVGLGKSIIASCIAINLLEQKYIKKIIILSPPKILDSWESYSSDFNLKAEIISTGKLEKALEYKNTNSLIIIDEAHRFINEDTESYQYVKKICFKNKVMLLSATPMHNTTSDIFNLIDIFNNTLVQNDSIRKSIIKKEKKLKQEYKKDSDKDYKEATKDISKEVISLINPIIIRRTRKDLLENIEYKKDLEAQETEFNKVKEPILHSYNLESLSDLYLKTFNKIRQYTTDETDTDETLKFVRYEPLVYLKESKESKEVIEKIYGDGINFDFASTSSRNLAGFMRHLLIRRFESSIYAFKKTLDNMIEHYKKIEFCISNGYYIIDKKSKINFAEDFDFYYNDDFDEGVESNIDEKISSKLKFNDKAICEYKMAYFIRDIDKVFREEFFTELKKDLEILKEIRDEWKDIKVQDDRKFDNLIKELKALKKENPNRKIIIFSEFKDTVEYLYDNICKDDKLNSLLKPIKFTSKDKDRETIRANFDASYKNKEDDYFLLIATDTLSEGINLHRAGIIINYDIPYNPTRVIQRVGRINRIGKKVFDELEIHNFIPRVDVQNEVKNWQISNFKLSLINAIFGNDTKILKSDDDINALFSLDNNDNSLDSDDISWDSEYRNDYDIIKKDENILKVINSIEDGATISRESNFYGLLKVMRKNNTISTILYDNGILNYNIENAFKILKCRDKTEKYSSNTTKLDYYEREIKRRMNTNSINTDSLEYILFQFSKQLSDDDFEYIKSIIENRDLLFDYADSINNCFRASLLKKGHHAIIEALKRIVSVEFIFELANREKSFFEEDIILREEFYKK